LTSVTFPNNVNSIGSLVFYGCARLTAFTMNGRGPACSSVAGVLFNTNQTTLIQYPPGKAGGYTVPNTVTSIADYAFDTAILSNVVIGSNVTLPGSVTTLGQATFFRALA